MRNSTKKLMLICLLIIVNTAIKADHLADRLLFSARLNGMNIIPNPVTGNGSGLAGFMLNNTRDTLYFTFNATNLSGAITGFHIHRGMANDNGPVVMDLMSSLNGSFAKGRIIVDPMLLKDLLNSNLYLVAHTSSNPNGEIRGQIKLESDYGNYAELDGMQQVPSNNSSAKGVAAINLGLDNKRLEVKVVTNNLSGAIQGAHLHRGKVGENGGLLVDLSSLISNNGTSLFGSVIVDDSIKNLLQNYIRNGEVYLNLHTSNFPNGELRGQIKYDNNLRFDARLDTTQIVGNLASPSMAIGAAKLSLSKSFDTLKYYIVVTNLTGNIAAAHIHQAEPNQDGPVVFEFPSTAFNNNVISGEWTSTTGLNQNLVNQLLYGNLYIAVHTSLNPGGELRGQIFRLAREGFVAEIDANQSVPSSTSSAMGSGIVSYDRDRTSLHYMITVSNLSGPINAAHFHKGIKSETGGVIYELNFTNEASFGYWDFQSMPAFNNAQSITFRRNDSVYVNFHTSNFPNGEIRGQFIRNYMNNGIVVNQTTNVNYENGNKFNAIIFPNPASNFAKLYFENQFDSELQINIYDLNGRLVYNLSTKTFAGSNVLDLDIKELNNGLYNVQVNEKGNNIINKKLLINR